MPLEKSSGLAHVDQDLAVQVGLAGLAEGFERARPGGGVDDQVGVGRRLGEAAQGDLGMPLVPCRERLLLHGARIGAGQQGGGVAVPSIVSWPSAASLAARVCPTTPLPWTAIFTVATSCAS